MLCMLLLNEGQFFFKYESVCTGPDRSTERRCGAFCAYGCLHERLEATIRIRRVLAWQIARD